MLKSILPLIAVLLPLAGKAEDLTFQHKQIEQKMPPGQLAMEVEFPFENHGKQGVSVTRFETGCQCLTGIPLSKPVAPGQKGTIKATFTAQPFWDGMIAKSLVVHFDNGQTETLTCMATLSAAARVSPWSLHWISGNAIEEKSVTICFPEGADAQISGIVMSRPGFAYRFEEVSPGRNYKIHFTPPPSGEPMFVTAKITTTSRFAAAKQFNVFLLLKPKEPTSSKTP